jgi:hypothetical protein
VIVRIAVHIEEVVTAMGWAEAQAAAALVNPESYSHWEVTAGWTGPVVVDAGIWLDAGTWLVWELAPRAATKRRKRVPTLTRTIPFAFP